ncbi:MAG: hypothetical protein Q7S99_03695 [Parvibaculum sp.]|nr:hypothetical protein [Parvibaculum sp.]
MVRSNKGRLAQWASLALLGAFVLHPAIAGAGQIVATNTVVMNDKFHTKSEWGDKLVLPSEGKITRVMDGTYGFDIKTEAGVQVASFLDPQQAIGLSLPAGTYLIEPYVCKLHRHHHIEVTASY